MIYRVVCRMRRKGKGSVTVFYFWFEEIEGGDDRWNLEEF